jgi:hypothetical protein
MIICRGVVLFWSSLFGVLEVSCIWMGNVFSRMGNFLLLFCWLYYRFLFIAPILLFNVLDSQIWSFDEVGEFLHIRYTGLELSD